jgi:hypothetical protein
MALDLPVYFSTLTLIHAFSNTIHLLTVIALLYRTQYMRVLEPFFNNNFDDSYTRLKNKAKEVLALMVQSASSTRRTVLS